MKNLILILFMGIFSCSTIQAQITAFDGTAFSFIAKDASGQLMTNQTASIVIQLRANSASGSIIYEENNSLPIPIDGVVSGVIGQGTATIGTFSTIDWTAQDVYLDLELNSVSQGTMKFYAVPYAQYAKVADVATSLVDKNIVVVSEANYQTVVIDDNDIIKIDTIINLINNNPFSTSKSQLSITGGGFIGTSQTSSNVSLGFRSTASNMTLKNVNVSCGTFINCTFEDVNVSSGRFIGCIFTGTINLLTSGIITDSYIQNATFPSVVFQFESIQNTEITNSSFTTIIHSLENNFIRNSSFDDVWRITNNEIRNSNAITVRYAFSENRCSYSSINTYNDNGFLDPVVIANNTFSSNGTSSPFIRINTSTSFDYLNIIISNNIFTGDPTLSEHIDFIGSHTAPDEGNIQIQGNTFRNGSRAFVFPSGNISFIVKDNVTMSLTHPAPIGGLTSNTAPVRIVIDNHVL